MAAVRPCTLLCDHASIGCSYPMYVYCTIVHSCLVYVCFMESVLLPGWLFLHRLGWTAHGSGDWKMLLLANGLAYMILL
jgi:hypothetical protein